MPRIGAMADPSESSINRFADPDAPSSESPHPRRELLWTVLSTLLFSGFVLLAWWAPDTALGNSLSGDLTFFLILNLSIVFLIVLVFLVGRNIVRLTIDRRRGLFGSRLRTRLVLLFVGMSLAPSLILVVVARGFLNEAIDTWFDSRVRNALQGSVEVADSYYLFVADNALHTAITVAQHVARRATDPQAPANAASWQRLAEDRRAELNLAGLEVFGLAEQAPRRSQSPTLTQSPPLLSATERNGVLSGNELLQTIPIGSADIVRASVPVRDAAGTIIGGVAVEVLIPDSVARNAREISGAYAEFVQASRLERPLRNQYVLTLALVAMVVFFAATWVGMRQARNITVPLLDLARGTREVAQGNWKYRIAPASDQETGVLVDSFNRMTADLEASHAESEARRKYAESILAHIAAGVVSLDRRGIVTTVNPAAEAMLGLHREFSEGAHWTEVFGRPELVEVGEVIADLSEAPERLLSRQIRLSAGDQSINALVSATTLPDETGAPSGGMLFFENVTDLLRVQRMEAWREVARRLAHEIKNPLTPIKLSAQRLRRRYMTRLDVDERGLLDECTATIVAQVDAMQKLVSEFSTFARLPAVALVPQDINDVVEHALALFRQGHAEISFRFAPSPQLPSVPLDREALVRVIINILDNAVAACEAAPDRAGEVELATRYVAGLEVVCLEISDNGCGMSAEVKHRIFEPYFSTKKDGTGLGMAIVSAIVADHRGYIRAGDNEPHGSRFTIHFPVGVGEHHTAETSRG